MADFVQTMKDWKRMCISCQPNCEKCGLFEMGCDTANMMDEPVRAEKMIAKWVEEHPEPVYPTWYEWLTSIGAVTRKVKPDVASNLIETGLLDPIPANIAEKLGIIPKESN